MGVSFFFPTINISNLPVNSSLKSKKQNNKTCSGNISDVTKDSDTSSLVLNVLTEQFSGDMNNVIEKHNKEMNRLH